MKTGMEFDVGGVAIPKPSILSLYLDKDRETSLGEAQFDLAEYSNLEGKSKIDRLPLKNCSYDDNAFIEIHIRAQV